jgi:hypothetical protein
MIIGAPGVMDWTGTLTISSISNYFSPTVQCVRHRAFTAESHSIMLYNLIVLQCC